MWPARPRVRRNPPMPSADTVPGGKNPHFGHRQRHHASRGAGIGKRFPNHAFAVYQGRVYRSSRSSPRVAPSPTGPYDMRRVRRATTYTTHVDHIQAPTHTEPGLGNSWSRRAYSIRCANSSATRRGWVGWAGSISQPRAAHAWASLRSRSRERRPCPRGPNSA